MTSTLECQKNVDLQTRHTFALPAKAMTYVDLQSVEQLPELAACCERHSQIIILGEGSNTIFTGNTPACVIHNQLLGVNKQHEDEQSVVLHVAAGENWHQLVSDCVDQGYGGIENLALIPGTVGAAPVQNIGAYGVEICQILETVEVFDLKTHKQFTLSNEDCGFAYRDSIFKHPPYHNRYLITGITLRLQKQPQLQLDYAALKNYLQEKDMQLPSLRQVYDAVISIRQSKLPDPKILANAGSFFKNPLLPKEQFASLQTKHPNIPGFPVDEHHLKVSAAWMIEQCGFRGKKINHLACYEKQALIIVNDGAATGTELINFTQKIIDSVHQTFGITLCPEVNFYGVGELTIGSDK